MCCCQRELCLEGLAAARTDGSLGAHLGATGRTVEGQLSAAVRAAIIALADRFAALGADRLAAAGAAARCRVYLCATPGAALAKVEVALGAALHVGLEPGLAARAEELQLGLAAGAPDVVLAHRCAAGRAERLLAGRALAQPQANLGAARWAGACGVQAADGTDDLFAVQQQEAAGAHPLAAPGAGPQLAAE